MKLMVSLVLLVAICHAADAFRNRREDEDQTAAKRQLKEGNFGQKIQPSVEAFPSPQSGYDDNKNQLREGPPQREYGPPGQPVAKISDVLSGQGPSFPAAIQSHLYSPVQVYQPRLGSPTTFEISPPVPSQLAYAEHKIYQAPPIEQFFKGNQAISHNIQPPLQNQNQPQQINPFPRFQQLQHVLPPRPDLPNEFLPRLESPKPRNQIPPQQIYQQVFAEQSGVIPQDIYQQINQLSSQINYDDSIQSAQASEQLGIGEMGNVVKQQNRNPEIRYANQVLSFVQEGQKIDDQTRESQQQSSTQQPQAVSYASFSQGLPASSQSRYQSQQDETRPLLLPPQQQQLPQSQSPPLFQPAQTTRAQSSFRPIETTPFPQTTTYTTVNQTPHQIGIVNIRQNLESTTPHTFTVSTEEPQGSSTSTSTVVSSDDISQSTAAEQQMQTTRYSTPVTRSRPTFRPYSRSTFATRSPQQSLQSQKTFSSRPTFSPLLRRRTTLQTFSTSPSSTLPPRPTVIIQTSPTLPPQPALETLSSLPPQPAKESISTLPPQPLAQTATSLSPSTLQPQFIPPSSTSVPFFTPQQVQLVSVQPQLPSTLQPLQSLPTLQPLPVTQLLPTSLQPSTTEVTPLPKQGQFYEVQSESQPGIQIQEYNKEKQQISQQLPTQPQPFPQFQFIHGPQQIQQQLQLIQQQLQLLQQQQPYIQQQPQPVQIIQQQNTPFPQPVQFIQQQPTAQTPAQLIQQQPQASPEPQPLQQQSQLIQQNPQLIHAQPQLIQTQPQLIQPQSQLIQSQPQLIQSQPLVQPQLQLVQQQPQLVYPQPQLIQPQPQIVEPQPQLSQPQLIQPQPQPSQPEPVQSQVIQSQPQAVLLVQQQPEPSTQPQIEIQQNSQQQQQNQNNLHKQDKSEKKESTESQRNENENYYNQLLQNSLFSEELYASIQPQPLFPVPVAFPSYPAASALHSSIHSSHLHSPPLHSPLLHGHSYHSTHTFPSVQYFGKHANSIFGGGWRKK